MLSKYIKAFNSFRGPFIKAALLLLLFTASNVRASGAKPPRPQDVARDTSKTASNAHEQARQKRQARRELRIERRINRHYLAELRREEKAARDTSDKKYSKRFYYSLAVAFTRLRMYPLAMKCYFKTLAIEQPSRSTAQGVPTAAGIMPASFPLAFTQSFRHDSLVKEGPDSIGHVPDITKQDWDLLNRDSIPKNGDDDIKSAPEATRSIVDPFNDGKKAVAYALLVHVKQPEQGRRKIFVLNNVGHTFITVIKYNADSTVVCRSFGFYPKKGFILQATPLIPSAPGIFKDDAKHNWDEVTGTFIPERTFSRIMSIIKKYDHKQYHLSNLNCTDFGLEVATEAGIKIDDSKGSWPLGSGNNPACAGQSMREGKVYSLSGSLLMVNDTLNVKR